MENLQNEDGIMEALKAPLVLIEQLHRFCVTLHQT
ncbi:hypothetical protein BDE36_4758 [Arcticibacter tournemirensis]|nr:hypothetical protein BDE36_4758 [Arcticibacter tournemirensis]